MDLEKKLSNFFIQQQKVDIFLLTFQKCHFFKTFILIKKGLKTDSQLYSLLYTWE